MGSEVDVDESVSCAGANSAKRRTVSTRAPLLVRDRTRSQTRTLFDTQNVADEDGQRLRRKPLALELLRVLVVLLRLEPFALLDALARRPRRTRALVVRHVLRLFRRGELGVARRAEPRQGRVDDLVRNVRGRTQLVPALVAALADDELWEHTRVSASCRELAARTKAGTHPVLVRRVSSAAHLAHQVRVERVGARVPFPPVDCEGIHDSIRYIVHRTQRGTTHWSACWSAGRSWDARLFVRTWSSDPPTFRQRQTVMKTGTRQVPILSSRACRRNERTSSSTSSFRSTLPLVSSSPSASVSLVVLPKSSSSELGRARFPPLPRPLPLPRPRPRAFALPLPLGVSAPLPDGVGRLSTPGILRGRPRGRFGGTGFPSGPSCCRGGRT